MLYVYNDARTQVVEVRPDPLAEGGQANPT
jgi:hypothetical protein